MNISAFPTPSFSPEKASAHLGPLVWEDVNRHLVHKALAEFSHELLLSPQLISSEGDWGLYEVRPEQDSATVYRFKARRLALDHWSIEPETIEKTIAGEVAALDALSLILEFAQTLGIKEAMLPTYLEEVSTTLYGASYKREERHISSRQLAVADYQTIEAGMTEGHPTFIANNGRIGFDAVDYRLYAPEAAHPVQIIWLAVSKERATFTSITALDYHSLIAAELDEATLQGFETRLTRLGLNPDDYWLMPAHPWQWFNKLAITFAADVARRYIVCLGYGNDSYNAQQSIRTFFNATDNRKHYVKTGISVLNMGFMRGLSPKYMLATPAINEWLDDLVSADDYLRQNGFSILREVAAIGYRYPYYDQGLKLDSPYKKMLSALWRESPLPRLRANERIMTMAALLHKDKEGVSLVAEQIAVSGLDAQDWIAAYLKAYLAPLIHCFYRYDLAFMPHGENLILVLEDNVPVRAIMKDIGEEIGILNGSIEVPEEISRISYTLDEKMKPNCIFTDVFDCFFRYLSATLHETDTLHEDRFWSLVAECFRTYQAEHPDYADKYQRYDFFADRFVRNCLNRLQLNNNQQMLDLLNPEDSLQYIGELENPLARFR
ncbi:IucA/IucC family siderophore biosynthesis protein [Agrobacterium rubi]|uniref:IucA/IucC family protein n=1 Tax=Agrobacterium rubi TaxID=28099 RepID=UPI00157339F9|nr:IucA/IucC family siderophore biosynthesis protein [Agrobacterium rubi]NTF09005.1 IucA/IucC family siderophore biosynthesis protein [Agrobacterium rubi]NTF21276.1 IucA/IucC family siderophore biosynthesis protein [Agrobacterium rubi]NTF28133.1 IucA/IucC family siderophore biosynthesis protein [Agrobacterium rubi]